MNRQMPIRRIAAPPAAFKVVMVDEERCICPAAPCQKVVRQRGLIGHVKGRGCLGRFTKAQHEHIVKFSAAGKSRYERDYRDKMRREHAQLGGLVSGTPSTTAAAGSGAREGDTCDMLASIEEQPPGPNPSSLPGSVPVGQTDEVLPGSAVASDIPPAQLSDMKVQTPPHLQESWQPHATFQQQSAKASTQPQPLAMQSLLSASQSATPIEGLRLAPPTRAALVPGLPFALSLQQRGPAAFPPLARSRLGPAAKLTTHNFNPPVGFVRKRRGRPKGSRNKVRLAEFVSPELRYNAREWPVSRGSSTDFPIFVSSSPTVAAYFVPCAKESGDKEELDRKGSSCDGGGNGVNGAKRAEVNISDFAHVQRVAASQSFAVAGDPHPASQVQVYNRIRPRIKLFDDLRAECPACGKSLKRVTLFAHCTTGNGCKRRERLTQAHLDAIHQLRRFTLNAANTGIRLCPIRGEQPNCRDLSSNAPNSTPIPPSTVLGDRDGQILSLQQQQAPQQILWQPQNHQQKYPASNQPGECTAARQQDISVFDDLGAAMASDDDIVEDYLNCNTTTSALVLASSAPRVGSGKALGYAFQSKLAALVSEIALREIKALDGGGASLSNEPSVDTSELVQWARSINVAIERNPGPWEME
jgi:hypothetical protein